MAMVKYYLKVLEFKDLPNSERYLEFDGNNYFLTRNRDIGVWHYSRNRAIQRAEEVNKLYEDRWDPTCLMSKVYVASEKESYKIRDKSVQI